MSEMLITASTCNDSLLTFDNWFLCDQVDSPVVVDNLSGVSETNISVIILIVSLQADVNTNVIQSSYNNNKSILLTCPVCVTILPSFSAQRAPDTCVEINLALRQYDSCGKLAILLKQDIFTKI